MPPQAATVTTRLAPATPNNPEAEQRTVQLGTVYRALEIRPDSFNEADNTVEVVWTTGATVRRYSWSQGYYNETLSTEAGHVRLDRLNAGASVLNCHGQYALENIIGVVVPGSARMENGQGVATVRLADTPDVADIVAKIRSGIIRNVSVGYVVHVYQETVDVEGETRDLLAIDWEPVEISFVAVPADAGAQVRSGDPSQAQPCIILGRVTADQTQERKESSMPPVENNGTGAGGGTTTQTADNRNQPAGAPPAQQPGQPQAVTVSAIRSAVSNAGLADDVAFALIERHEATPLTNDALMADIGRRFAERDAGARTTNRVSVTRDEGDTMRRGMEDAVFHRISPGAQLTDVGRTYRGMSLIRMAEEHLASAGVSVRGFSPIEIAERSLHTTSDFANLLGNALGRRLRAAYEENQPSYRIWARRAPNAPNFKSIDVVQMSAMPDLLKVNEAGEFKYGTISDGKVSYSVITYGRILGVSRQTIVNDDLRALERLTTGFAGSAARLENRTVYGLLTANAAMPDGTPLFHADHGNLAGAGAAIAATTLGAGRGAMRVQKGLQKEELNLAPRFLIVPAAQEQLAYQYTSSQFVPAKSSDVNEFRAGGRTALEPVVEAVLDGASAASWYMAAGNEQVDTVEYSYLEGSEGVQLSNRVGFTVDGVEFKASLDFGAAVIDHRGLYKNPGA